MIRNFIYVRLLVYYMTKYSALRGYGVYRVIVAFFILKCMGECMSGVCKNVWVWVWVGLCMLGRVYVWVL